MTDTNTQKEVNGIDTKKIAAAGKSIKYVVYFALAMVLLFSYFIFITIMSISSGKSLPVSFSLFLIIFSLILNCGVIYNLHSAGRNLEKSVEDVNL